MTGRRRADDHGERMVADAEEMAGWLRTHYGKKKIFVLGHSWGSLMGLELARRHPDWLHAYIGMGQMIAGPENERLGYEWALQQARAAHDERAVEELEAIAPYPRADGTVTVDRSSSSASG
jgi:pimeloyl-ACP methyl ester carboxylesterase